MPFAARQRIIRLVDAQDLELMPLRPSIKRILFGAALTALVTPPLLLLYLLYLFDWNRARDPLSAAASERSNRKIVIQGDLRPTWGWPVSRLRASGLTVGNVDGGSAPQMLDLDRIDIAINLRSLLKGKLELTEMTLVKPQLLLEKTRSGAVNWRFADNPAGGVALALLPDNREEFPIIGRLTVEDGRISYKDPAHHTDISLRAATVQGKADGDAQSVRFHGEGVLKGEPLKFDLTGGSVHELRDATAAYPVSAFIVAAQTSISMHGTAIDPVMLKGLDVTLTIKGSNAADLFPLTGIALPPTPPYDITGKLDYEAGVWRFRKFAGRLGDSDLAGDLSWDVRGKRPVLNASFTSRKLDLDDLAGLIGARPGTGPGETASAEQVAAASAAQSDPRMLPDMPLDISRLAAMDAKVEVRGLSVVTNKLPINDFYLKAELVDRVLQISPVRFGTGSGNFVVWATINAQREPVRIVSRTELQRIPIASMFDSSSAAIGTQNLARGYLGGTVELNGSGQSLRQMLAGASGNFGIGMEGGQLSQVLVEMIGLDIAESMGYLLAGDRPVPVRCVIADFKVTDGLLTPRTLVVDTDDTIVTGTGSINLKDESLRLELKPAPKDFSPLVLRVPLEIGGTLKNPDLHVKRSSLLARGAAAAALALLFPPAVILAFIEPGLGKDSQCRSLLSAMASNSLDPRNNARLVPSNAKTPVDKTSAEPASAKR